MQITSTHNSLSITGNIKSIHDFQEIKTSLEKILTQEKSVSINLIDSLSITSSVIGYLNKLVLKDKIELKINVGETQLIELFKDLNLTSVFNITKL